MRGHSAAGVAAAFVFFATGCGDAAKPAAGSEVTLTRVECSSCSIRLDTITTITDTPSDAVSFMTPPVVDSRGRLIVANANENGLLAFDSTGAQIAAWGKVGGGPGEIEEIGVIAVLPNDSIVAFEQSRETMLVFTSSFSYVREVKTGELECCLPPLALPTGRFVFSQGNGTAAIVASDGTMSEPMRLIPVDTTRGKDHCETCGLLILGLAGSPGMYWAATVSEYKVLLVDSSGAVARSFSRAVPWFEKWTKEPGMSGAAMPARLIGLYEAPDSVLWTIIMLPKEVPLSAAAAIDPMDGPVSGKAIGALLERQQTRVEAIDLASGKLLASQLFPGTFMILQSGHAILLKIDSSGDPHWSVGRLRLVGRPR